MPFRRSATLLIVFMVAGFAPRATAKDKPKPNATGNAGVVALLEPIRKKHDVPGIAGAVVEGQRKGTFLKAIAATGKRRLGGRSDITISDPWHLGSCTKAMTATLIGRLVDKRKLKWETTLEEAFPKLARVMHPAWKPVTLELLLGNRAGAPETLDADGLWGRLWTHQGTPTEARRTLLEGVVTKPPVSPPGTKYAYSNAGFAIAGHAAETMLKKPWERLMREELFEPLQMVTAGFGAPSKHDAPHGHRPAGGTIVPVSPGPGADNPPAIGPAGTVHASIGDWGRFAALHLRGARDGKRKLPVKRESLRRTHKPLDGQTYALGWGVTSHPWAGTVLRHAGTNTMWYCLAVLAPERDVAILITCNRGGDKAAKACDEAARALLAWHIKKKR